VAISIDNLINVDLTKGTTDLEKLGLMVGGKGEHKPYVFPPSDFSILADSVSGAALQHPDGSIWMIPV
jgi:hypothetical protein